MTSPLNEPLADAWVKELVDYDEALRLGRDPAGAAVPNSPLVETQSFLKQLQAVWRRPNQKVGPFTIVKTLGQGAIGISYLVEEPGTHRRLVVKALWPDLSADVSVRQQFLMGAATLQSLCHANIAALRSARQEGQVCMVVGEYCDGISLAHWRQQKLKTIAWPIATVFIARIAEILDPGHRQGFGHGNLKPSNILLTHPAALTAENLHEASIVLTDFGLARPILESRLSQKKGLPWPAPHYLAPEQLRSQVDGSPTACDLYALGVLWYELMTGRSPVRGTTREDVLSYARSARPVPPRQYRAEIPESVEHLLLQTLSVNPQDRPASAKQLAEECRALLPAQPEPRETPAWWRQWLGWM